MPRACLTASCVAAGTHLLHQQLGLINVVDAAIVVCFRHCFAPAVPKGLIHDQYTKSLSIVVPIAYLVVNRKNLHAWWWYYAILKEEVVVFHTENRWTSSAGLLIIKYTRGP